MKYNGTALDWILQSRFPQYGKVKLARIKQTQNTCTVKAVMSPMDKVEVQVAIFLRPDEIKQITL